MSKKTILIALGIVAAVVAVKVLRKRYAAQLGGAVNKAQANASTERPNIDSDAGEVVLKPE